MRVGYALLPEVLEAASWDDKQEKIEEFSKLLDNDDELCCSPKKKQTIILTLELIVLLCLPLMGFNGSPLTYSTIFDLEKPFHRDFTMKILKAFDSKKACNFLSFMEEQVAILLNLPVMHLPQ